MRLWRLISRWAVFTLTGLPAFAARTDTWHTIGRAQIDGELSAVYGSVALITGKERVSFVPLEALDDAETMRVAGFLKTKPASRPTWGNSSEVVTKALKHKLEILRGDELTAYDPGSLPEPEIYLIYFSAHWCPPCQRFTPDLVQAYLRLQQQIPQRFELIYVSSDRSPAEQMRYAREARMPWPVLKYSELGQAAPVERWAGNGIPCLVALTPQGRVIFHSYHGEEYLGPQQVLSSFEALVPMLQGASSDILRARHRLSVMQHLSAAGNASRPPKPYLVGLNAAHYQTLETDSLMMTLDLDERGKVTDAQTEPLLPAALQDQFNHDTADWLFLPAVEQGRPVARVVKVPLQLRRKKPAVTAGSN